MLGSSDFVAISLSDDLLKVVQLQGSGPGAKAVKFIKKDIKGMPDGDLSIVLKTSLAGFNTKSKNLCLVVPSSMTTTKNIEIPSVNPKEISSIINLQASRYTPYSRDEVQIGYISLGAQKASYTRVLLVIANKLGLRKQVSILERAGIKLKKVLFAPEGVAAFYSQAKNLKREISSVGIIDVGKKTTEFVVCLGSKVIASRAIPVGRDDLLAQTAQAKANIAEELSKSLESFQSEDVAAVPGRYLLTSNDPLTTDLAGFLKEKFSWIVEVVPYLGRVKASADIMKRMTMETSDNSFLDVIASASMMPVMAINLIPGEVEYEKSVAAQGRQVAILTILLIMALVLTGALFGSRLYFKDAFLEKITSDYKDKRIEVLNLEKISSKIKFVQTFLDNRMESLDVINELYKSVPKEIYLTSIAMEDNGTVSVQGISDVRSIIFKFGTTLKEKGLFKRVDVKSTTDKKDRDKDVSAFEIIVTLKTAPETEDEGGTKL